MLAVHELGGHVFEGDGYVDDSSGRVHERHERRLNGDAPAFGDLHLRLLARVVPDGLDGDRFAGEGTLDET